MGTQVKEEAASIIDQIKHYIPPMRGFFDLDKSLADYSHDLYDFVNSPTHRERQKLVIETVSGFIKQKFGEEMAAKLSLKSPLALNIVDHHQVLNHPAIISSNFVASCFESNRMDSPPIVVISSADVPPNNFFSLNGFQFSGKKVPLFSVSERESTSYYLQKRDFNFVERLKKADRFKDFSAVEQKFLVEEEAHIKALNYTWAQDYCDQISIIVRDAWPRMFAEDIRDKIPELLYMSQEELVRRLLIALIDGNNFVTAALFDKSFRDLIIGEFRGNVVAWREDQGKGTHFFWRKYPGQSRALRLFLKGDALVPHDDRYKDLVVALKPDEIKDMLLRREIYPSLFTIFAVLNFYCGVKPLVGYGSVMYLDLLKQTWIKVLTKATFKQEVENINLVDTSGFIGGLPLFFERQGSKLKTLYAYDIIFRGGMKADYLRKVMSLKFKDLIVVGATDMYEYYANKYIKPDERIKPSISSADLAEFVFGKII